MSTTPRADPILPALPAMGARRPWRICLAVAIVACLARLLYVQYFAVAMPFWDQWDAEGDTLVKPWLEGTLRLADLVHPHNEHRILPTRLTALATYVVTGQWNNIYEARVNALLYALIPAMLAWQAFRDHGARQLRWTLVPVALALAVLPLGWENFLVGFQSQFYFLIVFALAAVSLAATRHASTGAMAAVLLLSILSALTMASGLLTALAAACTYAIACYRLPGRRGPALVGIAALLAIALVAYASMPVIAAHRTLQAQGLADFVDGASHVLGWPIEGYHWAAPALWLPGLAALLLMAARKQGTRTDVAMAGFYAWSLAQALAITYGRGYGLLELSPRYSDLLVPGLFASAWFALRLYHWAALRTGQRVAAAALLLAFAATFFGGLAVRTDDDWVAMRARSDAMRLQSANVMQYLATGDNTTLEGGHFTIPYPNSARLRDLLDDPVIRSALFVELPPTPVPPAPGAPVETP